MMQGIQTQVSHLCSNWGIFPAPLWTCDSIPSIWIIYKIMLRKNFRCLPLLVFPEVTIVTDLLDGETQRWHHSAVQSQFPFDPQTHTWCSLPVGLDKWISNGTALHSLLQLFPKLQRPSRISSYLISFDRWVKQWEYTLRLERWLP